jgi:hypothetical protein
VEQFKSKDYDRLFDLVFNHGFNVPCCLDYSFQDSDLVFTDYAVVRKRDDGILVGVRGMTYSSADEFQVRPSKSFNSVKDMFKRDCVRDNLQWFDTFTPGG